MPAELTRSCRNSSVCCDREKKALRLLRKSNPPLLEWLKSPVGYRHDPVFAAEFGALFAAALLCALSAHGLRQLAREGPAMKAYANTNFFTRFYIPNPGVPRLSRMIAAYLKWPAPGF